jgi:A/G-specific adenine glycosylase
LKKKTASPIAPVPALLRWFDRNRRDLPWRRSRDIYSVWVSEVMLQQTQVKTVLPYYRKFLKRFPTLQRLADASLQEVLKAWEGLGYYSRARNLWLAARRVRDENQGRIPATYDGFRSLPGVGDYIAAAVLSIGRGLPLPVVDGNVLRVVSRWQGMDGDIRLAATKKSVHAFLGGIIPAKSPGRFNETMMELGALVCTPKNPLCPECPLRSGCFARLRGQTGVLPVKGRKKPVPTHRVALAVIVRRGKIYIQRRPEEGHLGGLWEFPGGKCAPGEEPRAAVARECLEELGVEVVVSEKLAQVSHAYSHFKVVLHVFVCRLRGPAPRADQPHAWVRYGELRKYPFPAANHKFFPQIKNYLAQ